MQRCVSQLALAAVLLVSNVWAAKACSDLTSAIPPVPVIEMTFDEAPSTVSTIADSEFAVPDWILLVDHEGDSFTFVSASQLYNSSSNEPRESEFGDASTSAAVELNLPRILVDDEGIPLFSFAEAFSAAEITGSTMPSETEMAVDGYEDR